MAREKSKRLPPPTAIPPLRTAVGCLPLYDITLATQWAWLPDDSVRISCCWSWLGLLWSWSSGFLGHCLLRLLLHHCRRNTAIAVVQHHRGDNLRHHLLQLIQELPCLVSVLLYLTEFLLPDASQLGALQQVLVDEANKLNARRSGFKALANFPDVVALEQGLDDGRAR